MIICDLECSTLPTAAELNTLIFIKQSLITFQLTFTSQISVFSNKMTVLTGTTVSAATLNVPLIFATGEIAVVTAGNYLLHPFSECYFTIS